LAIHSIYKELSTFCALFEDGQKSLDGMLFSDDLRKNEFMGVDISASDDAGCCNLVTDCITQIQNE